MVVSRVQSADRSHRTMPLAMDLGKASGRILQNMDPRARSIDRGVVVVRDLGGSLARRRETKSTIILCSAAALGRSVVCW